MEPVIVARTPGTLVSQYIRTLAIAKSENKDPRSVAERNGWYEVKAAVSAMNTAGGDSALSQPIQWDYAAMLRPRTIVGKFGTNGIPALRRVPFRTRMLQQTSGATSYWTGEGAGKPVVVSGFTQTVMPPTKT